VFARPDNQVNFTFRTLTGQGNGNVGAMGGTDPQKYVRLVRAGNVFTAYYSLSDAGPWAQIGSPANIAMGSSVYVGLAVTSRDGGRLCEGVLSNVSVIQGGTPVTGGGALGLFQASQDVYRYWAEEDLISSFLLKKGYQVVMSEHAAGQGASKVYIATEEDIAVNLPPELNKKVSFMRVIPWRWIAKKGWDGNAVKTMIVGGYWNYEWEPTGSSSLDREFVPMIKGRRQNKESRWEEVRVRSGQTHFLGFNEPMSTNQGDLTVDEAIALWPKAQKLGLRLGSPARTDGANGDNWLKEFMQKAKANGYRVDFVCVHNYNQTGAAGLKNWLEAEYNKYKLPIWLTEFHRADGTSNQTRIYLNEVLPMLENLPFLERYAYFNFSGETGIFGPDGDVNALGEIYRDIKSTPAYIAPDYGQWCTIELSQPSHNAVISGHGGVLLSATVSLSNSIISEVEFYMDDTLLGTATSAPYQIVATNLPPGVHHFYATVTTTFGEKATSPAREARVVVLNILPASAGTVRWSTMPGLGYRVEYSDSLVQPVWQTLTQRTAANLIEQVTDSTYSTRAARFYRVAWIP
jgi:hypothetical protein